MSKEFVNQSNNNLYFLAKRHVFYTEKIDKPEFTENPKKMDSSSYEAINNKEIEKEKEQKQEKIFDILVSSVNSFEGESLSNEASKDENDNEESVNLPLVNDFFE